MGYRTWWGASANEYQEETRTRKGPWTAQEDMVLIRYIRLHGEGRWTFLAKATGLNRTGKSCRLRWVNYLRSDLKRSKITHEEERLIIELHGRLGNRWSSIAQSLPGRTDNYIKNYWRTRITKRINLQGENGSQVIETDKRVQFQPSSTVSCCLAASSQSPSDVDSAEPSSSFPRQNTEEIAVQTNTIPYLQEYISLRESPVCEANGNYEYGLHGQIHDRHINNGGQPGAGLQEHFEVSSNLFENRLPYTFSMGVLATDLLWNKYDGTEDGIIPLPSSSIVASPEAFYDSESYLNCYSDKLWIMDKEDDPFIHSQQLNSNGSYSGDGVLSSPNYPAK